MTWTIVEFEAAPRVRISKRAGVAALKASLMILVLLAFPFTEEASAAVPTIQAQNPSDGGPGTIISDKDSTTDDSYHFVARVSDAGGLGSHIAGVSVSVEDGDSDVTADATLSMSRVDSTDTWEVFWSDITATVQSGAVGVTFTVADTQGNITTDTVVAQIDRTAETAEIETPANGDDLRFVDTDGDGKPQAKIEGSVSLGMTAGEDRVDLYYSTSTASENPVWTSCGPAAAIAANRTFSADCELSAGVAPEQVTMVAARAVNIISCVPPTAPECQVIPPPGATAARPQSGDAHRIQGIGQELNVDATPEEDTNLIGGSHTVLTEVTDQDGVAVVGVTVNVEYSGANDRDDSFSTSTVDDRCRTDSDGTCRVVIGPDPAAQGDESPAVTETTTETGRTTATVWVGSAPDAGESPSSNDDDATDVVLKDWVEGAEPPGASEVQYIPEGATHSGFTTFVLIANPNDFDVTASVTFLTQSGAQKPDAVQNLELAPGQRRTIDVNTTLGLGFDVATKVEASAPVVAEGSMHFGGSLANSDMMATSQTSDTWFQAEGATHSGFTTFILIANPDEDTDSTVHLTFLAGGTEIDGGSRVIPKGSRRTVDVSLECGCQADVSTLVEVTSGPQVVTSRALHKRGPGGDLAVGASVGTTSTAYTWVVPEGATHSDWHTFILIANPNETESVVNIKFLRSGAEQTPDSLQGYVVGARSRRTIDVNVECGCQDDVSTVVDSVEGSVAVEGTIQKENAFGFVIADSLGSPGNNITEALGSEWASAEGATHSGFTTFILLSNPTDQEISVELSFTQSNGSSLGGRSVTLAPSSRQTVDVRQACIDADAVTDGECATDVWTFASSNSGFVMELAIDRGQLSVGFSKGRSLSSRLVPFSET